MQSSHGHSNWSSPNLAHWYQYCAYQASALGNPKNPLLDFPQLFPPREEFLSSKIELRLLFLRNLVSLKIFLECVLITKNDVGIHSASSTGYPCHKTKDSPRYHRIFELHHRVFELHRHRKIFSTLKYFGLFASSNSTSHGTCCTMLGLHYFSNDT